MPVVLDDLHAGARGEHDHDVALIDDGRRRVDGHSLKKRDDQPLRCEGNKKGGKPLKF